MAVKKCTPPRRGGGGGGGGGDDDDVDDDLGFLFFLFYLYRGYIAVLKYVRSYLHSLGLVTETNKIICCYKVNLCFAD